MVFDLKRTAEFLSKCPNARQLDSFVRSTARILEFLRHAANVLCTKNPRTLGCDPGENRTCFSCRAQLLKCLHQPSEKFVHVVYSLSPIVPSKFALF